MHLYLWYLAREEGATAQAWHHVCRATLAARDLVWLYHYLGKVLFWQER